MVGGVVVCLNGNVRGVRSDCARLLCSVGKVRVQLEDADQTKTICHYFYRVRSTQLSTRRVYGGMTQRLKLFPMRLRRPVKRASALPCRLEARVSLSLVLLFGAWQWLQRVTTLLSGTWPPLGASRTFLSLLQCPFA
jgi:hypothetical protein